MKKYSAMIFVFIATFVVLFSLNLFKIFGTWDSILYWIGAFAMFFIGYFIFEYLQQEIKFNFAESYVGILLLVVLYLGFWLAFRIYYGNIANLNNIAYSEFYTKQNLNLFKDLINSQYIYMALSFFGGWLAFYIDKVSKNKEK